MNTSQYAEWCNKLGYITANDWGYQTIGRSDYYFILNPKTDKFALIKFTPARIGTGFPDWYDVLVQNWVDHNDWAEQFHKETQGGWK